MFSRSSLQEILMEHVFQKWAQTFSLIFCSHFRTITWITSIESWRVDDGRTIGLDVRRLKIDVRRVRSHSGLLLKPSQWPDHHWEKDTTASMQDHTSHSSAPASISIPDITLSQQTCLTSLSSKCTSKCQPYTQAPELLGSTVPLRSFFVARLTPSPPLKNLNRCLYIPALSLTFHYCTLTRLVTIPYLHNFLRYQFLPILPFPDPASLPLSLTVPPAHWCRYKNPDVNCIIHSRLWMRSIWN